MAAEEPGVLALRAKNPYQIGTLTYTKMGLASVFFWLLWGDFCFTLMETVMPAVLPLTLKDAGASNLWIGLVVGTIPATLYGVACPVVSFISDRHRGPRGRRIPFLLWSAPLVTLFLIFIGYSTEIGTWLHGWLQGRMPATAFSRTYVLLGVTAFCVVCFQFFNSFVMTAYYCLWVDVVPEAFKGHFIALFRVVGAGATWIWSYYIFGYAQTHTRYIFLGISVVYCAAFEMMCLRVKESEYPPPPPRALGLGPIGLVKTYFYECFTHPYYICLFLATTLATVSTCSILYSIFLYRDTLKLSLGQIGGVNAWCSILAVLLFSVSGYVSNWLHPLRLLIASHAFRLVTAILCFFFIHDRNTMLIFLLLSTAPTAFAMTGNALAFAALLPRERYGQFMTASGIPNSLGMALGNVATGLLMDWLRDYRYVFIWTAVFTALALVPYAFVYFGWLRHGGPANYVPPI